MAQAMYAGYVNVNASHGKNLFYWMVEAANSPATAPLVLWTNGCEGVTVSALRAPSVQSFTALLHPHRGPGCSGISGGLMSEFGPFFPAADGSLALTPNAYTWTQVSDRTTPSSPVTCRGLYDRRSSGPALPRRLHPRPPLTERKRHLHRAGVWGACKRAQGWCAGVLGGCVPR